jgi:hypothetical protein
MNQATQNRPYTPPFAGLTMQSSRGAILEDSLADLDEVRQQHEPIEETKEQEEEVEVVYDPVLNCYYDPNTHEYYELS